MLRKLHRRLKAFFKKEKRFRYLLADDIPPEIKPYKIYLVSNQEYQWQMMMLCPCGCKTILYLSLLKESKPNWTYTISNKNRISIHPSIHRKTDCKSHFYIRQGKVSWCDK
jgi:hypothetical protein